MNTATALSTRPRTRLPYYLALSALLAFVLVFRHHLRAIAAFWVPWEFSPTVLVTTFVAGWAYTRGLLAARRQGTPVSAWKALSFYLGLGLLYFMLQSQFDYYSQHMFFMHRLQHLVLHHLGPFFVALSDPGALILAGTPVWLDRKIIRPVCQNRWVRKSLDVIQSPVAGPIVFVGLLYFWLIPDLHFDAMMNADIYKAMNWSMALDGLFFWLLIFDPRPKPQARLSYGLRIIVLWAIMLPQIVLGAVIGLTTKDMYPIYALCGRAFNIDAVTDQHIGGYIIWIPASMMSVIASLIVLRMLLKHDKLRHGG